MAANNIIIGSKFKPFSYEELLKPVMMAQVAHTAMEDEYSALSSQAEIWKNMANKETSPVAYNLYQTFASNLDQAANTLATEGLSPTNRQSLLNVRKLYKSNITPIEQAYTKKQALAEEQRKLRGSDQTMMFDVEIPTLSLDKFIGKDVTYTPYSGAVLIKQTAEAAKQLTDLMQSGDPKWTSILGGQYWQSKIRNGYTPEQILLTAQEDPNAPKELTSIIDNVLSANKITKDKGDLYNQSRNYALLGLREAIGGEKYQMQSNKQFDFNQEVALAKAKADIDYENEKRKAGITAGSPNDYFVPLGTAEYDPKQQSVTNDYRTFIEMTQNPKDLYESPKVKNERFGDSIITKEGLNPKYTKAMENLAKKYGYNGVLYTEEKDASGKKKLVINENFKKLLPQIEADVAKNVKRNTMYKLNVTNTEIASNHLIGNAIVLGSNGKSPLKELKDNGDTGRITNTEASEYFNENGAIVYMPKKGIIYAGISKDNTTKKFVLDPEMFGNELVQDALDGKKKNKYQAQMNLIDHLIEDGDLEEADKRISLLMSDIYSYFNTIEKTQSKTDSKI